ncbi:MAG: MopE-related protein [Actinomycetota bacterium]
MALRAAIVVLFVASPLMLSTGMASAATAHCNGVFSGKTPTDPISKTADKTEAYAGQTVTFTISFHSTGTATNVVTDCYRVDDGSDGTLNGLVTGFNEQKTSPNVGPKGSLQQVTFTITIPDDPSLIGHSIVDRGKETRGNVESRTNLVSVAVVAPPSTCETDCTPQEICGNGIDDNSNGQIDEGCPPATPDEICGNGIDDNSNGQIDENCELPPQPEICGNHIDDNFDGIIDENCPAVVVGGSGSGPVTHPAPKPTVKGIQLAHTGSAATTAAWLGSLLLILGMAGRFSGPRPITGTVEIEDSSANPYLVRYTDFLRMATRSSAGFRRPTRSE